MSEPPEPTPPAGRAQGLPTPAGGTTAMPGRTPPAFGSVCRPARWALRKGAYRADRTAGAKARRAEGAAGRAGAVDAGREARADRVARRAARARRAPGRLTVALVYGAAGVLAAAGLGWVRWEGVAQPGMALAFAAMIAAGEAFRWVDAPGSGGGGGRGPSGGETMPRDPWTVVREPAPVAAAAALAYALLSAPLAPPGPDRPPAALPQPHGVLQAVAVVVAAGLVALVPRLARGRSAGLDHLARRVLTVAFAATCCQPLDLALRLAAGPPPRGGSPHLPPLHHLLHLLCLLLLLALAALCDAVLAAALARARAGWRYGPLLRDELRALPRAGSAICATAVVMVLAVRVAGLWALPVFSLPLLLTQYSFRRYADVRATYRQTIASLARATEIAGYTPAGHARRVAGLSRAVGRELGLPGEELTMVEYAALMHDIGQLSLVDPVPAGATEQLPAAEQQRIALLGGAVVRQTGVPAQVAVIVERQAEPYREQPLTARIVRVANAYAELTCDAAPAGRPGGEPGAALRALERLRLGTARDFDPAVVAALARVLARGGPGK
nr:HD domain-containing phosphohydrolase [Streptomyces sp. SAJ15]